MTTTVATWTRAQKGLLALAVVLLVHNTIGLIANPSFATGHDAHVESVLWLDMNGWHALAGYMLALPALVAALRPRWAVVYAAYMALALVASAAFILADHDAAGLADFGDGAVRDAIYHVVFAVLLGTVALVGARDARRVPGHR